MSADTPLSEQRVGEIRARYESLQGSRSKPGLHTLDRGARLAIPRSAEHKLARQDIPALLSDHARLSKRVEAIRDRILAAGTGHGDDCADEENCTCGASLLRELLALAESPAAAA